MRCLLGYYSEEFSYFLVGWLGPRPVKPEPTVLAKPQDLMTIRSRTSQRKKRKKESEMTGFLTNGSSSRKIDGFYLVSVQVGSAPLKDF